MQFKKVGGRIQVLAYTGYSQEKKRAVVKLKGSFCAIELNPDSILLNSMTAEEKTELQSYIDSVLYERKKQYDIGRVNYITVYIKEAAALISAGHALTVEQAVLMRSAIEDLTAALSGQGFKRAYKKV